MYICLFIGWWSDCVFQQSFEKAVPPSFFELGFTELVSIYNELCKNGKRPPVIDAAELQIDPEVFEVFGYAWFNDSYYLMMENENMVMLCSLEWDENESKWLKYLHCWKRMSIPLNEGRSVTSKTSL